MKMLERMGIDGVSSPGSLNTSLSEGQDLVFSSEPANFMKLPSGNLRGSKNESHLLDRINELERDKVQ